MENSNEITVLVTGIGGGGHGEQILKALKLARLPLKILGADMSSLSKGLSEVDKAFILPPASDPDYLERLLVVCRDNNVQALFHGSEPELKVMARNQDKIREAGLFLPVNPQKLIDTCMDKFKTMEFLTEHGFKVPDSWEIKSAQQIEDINCFPVVVKPSVGGGGSAHVYIAQNSHELMIFGQLMLQIFDTFIVQQYIGTPEDEFTVGVLHDMDGNYVNAIAVKKQIMSSLSNSMKLPNRSGNEKLGRTLAISSGISQGHIGTFSEVTEPCKRMAAALQATGPINIQCRFYEGEVFVFEINPRFSGTTSLRAMVGYNEPEILLRRHILQERIEADFAYQEGFIARGLSETFFPGL